MGFKSIVAKKQKENKAIERVKIGKNGEVRETAAVRIRPSIWQAFCDEIDARRKKGEKITRGEVIEELIENWLKGGSDE